MKRLIALLVAVVAVAAAIAVPAATAGTDTGIGVPAGRDGVDTGAVVKGENYYARGLPAQAPAPAPAPIAPTSTAFQWGDAGIGAASSFGIVALAFGGVLVLRRRRVHLRMS
jgi:hypothetical protein